MKSLQLSSTKFNIFGRWVIVLFIALAALFQTLQIAERRLVPAAIFARDNIGESGQIRGARALEGDDFAGYIDFLRRNIPQGARVMLPPRVPVRPTAHMGLMQYYLFPRELHNCGPQEVDACIGRVNESPDFYILGLKGFPPHELIAGHREYLSYNDSLGLYLP